jgi:type I restriction enzyme, S subunit
MELMEKQGYKQTEVGLIPEDWKVYSTIDSAKNGESGIKIGPFGSALKKELLVKTGFKVYGQENVFEKNAEIGDRYITLEHFRKLKSCELISGDFIISMMGTIGQSMILPDIIEEGIMDSHLLRIRLDESKVFPNYFEHIFSSPISLNQVKKLSVGGIMDGLSSKIVKRVRFPFPPTLTEQKAIATALSDVDDLIANLELLITKKKAIKQGAMQQLLTPPHKGGKRLAGFTGEWERVQINKVITVARGGSPRPIQNFMTSLPDGVNWIKIGDTSKLSKYITSTKEKIIPEGEQFSRSVKVGDFLLSNSMSFGRPYILKIDGCIHDGWLVLQNYQDSFDREFLYYTLMSKDIFDQYMMKASGSGVLNLNKELVKVVELNRPKDLKEQVAIAEILSDMDNDITLLETKKAKYQDIKQGMMQELLTGKTRLV